MARIIMTSLALAVFLGSLPGCYGVAVSKKCKACVESREGKADGAEWAAEYVNEQFQCKLEGGKIKIKIEDYWKDCG